MFSFCKFSYPLSRDATKLLHKFTKIWKCWYFVWTIQAKYHPKNVPEIENILTTFPEMRTFPEKWDLLPSSANVDRHNLSIWLLMHVFGSFTGIDPDTAETGQYWMGFSLKHINNESTKEDMCHIFSHITMLIQMTHTIIFQSCKTIYKILFITVQRAHLKPAYLLIFDSYLHFLKLTMNKVIMIKWVRQ